MENVAIFPVTDDTGGQYFRAVSRTGQSEGRTAGEALDALRTATFPSGQSSAVVVIQSYLSDPLFTAAEQTRLQELMSRWRAARDAGKTIPSQEGSELEALVEKELQAAARRSAQIMRELTE